MRPQRHPLSSQPVAEDLKGTIIYFVNITIIILKYSYRMWPNEL